MNESSLKIRESNIAFAQWILENKIRISEDSTLIGWNIPYTSGKILTSTEIYDVWINGDLLEEVDEELREELLCELVKKPQEQGLYALDEDYTCTCDWNYEFNVHNFI